MNNVIPIHHHRTATSFNFAKNGGGGFDTNFFLGVLVFGVLPEVVAITYYGILLAVVLVISASLGIGLGFAIHRIFPSRIQTLDLHASSQVLLRGENMTRKAA